MVDGKRYSFHLVQADETGEREREVVRETEKELKTERVGVREKEIEIERE